MKDYGKNSNYDEKYMKTKFSPEYDISVKKHWNFVT